MNRYDVSGTLRGLWLFVLLMSAAGQLRGDNPFESCAQPRLERSEIDRLVFKKLEALKIQPARLCSDSVFVRRVYLDLAGKTPSAQEAERFILDPNPGKRHALIEGLLARDEFADYLALKWGDLLRIKAEFPINLWPNAAQAYHRWVREAIRDNKPIDQFARDLLTASGSNFSEPPANFYRAMQNRTPSGIAQTVALTFLGERADQWPSNQLAQFAVFFAYVGYKSTGEWKEEIVFFNPASTNQGALNGAVRPAVFPDGSPVTLMPDKDPRAVLAEWLVCQPGFARNIANRAWFWLLGRGIIQEPDDIRADNLPSNPELLAFLEKSFIASGYDFKALYRTILNSDTYQLSAISRDASPEVASNFASYPLRRLEAEVLIDVVDQITGATEHYSSAIPEPYTFVPDTLRSVELPDGSITSPVLEMFGRPPRDTGLESERNNRISASQKLFLLNSSQLQKKIESSRMVAFQSSPNRSPEEAIRGMYLGILSRYPARSELQAALAHFQSGIPKRQAVIDLAWALMNSAEFLYRH